MSKHLKSYAAPKSWNILRKVTKWILKPHPGAHTLEQSMPAGLVIKQLHHAHTSREAKKIIGQHIVHVDGKVIKDIHHGIGFMDTITLKNQKPLRCSIDTKGRLTLIEIPENEAAKKICRIIAKRTVSKGKIQISLSDGRTMIAQKPYAVGDSILIEVPSQNVLAHYPLAPHHIAFLTAGKHIGSTCTIDKIENEKIFCTRGTEKIETLKQFAFVVGKDSPAVKL